MKTMALGLLSFFVLNVAVHAEVLIMPKELVEVARNNGCSQVDDFYDRPGFLNPLYVNGYLPGAKENSVVLWCQVREGERRRFFLVVITHDKNHELARCPGKIEWNNYPGGLEIYKDRRTTLEGFVYLKDPNKRVPSHLHLRNNAILSEYDGVTEMFYCLNGEWLVRQRH